MHGDRLSTIFIASRCQAADLELRRLVAITRVNNKKRQITGCLFWTGQYFAQILEGTSVQLSQAVSRLCDGGRQTAPRILFQSQIDARQFDNSHLAFMPAPDFEEAVAEAHAGGGRLHQFQILFALLVQEHHEYASEPRELRAPRPDAPQKQKPLQGEPAGAGIWGG